MNDVLNKLTAYTFALRDALERTNESKERPQITKHLAATAEMYALLHMHQTTEAIAHIVLRETRSLELSALSGEGGAIVTSQWAAFIESTGIQLSAAL